MDNRQLIQQHEETAANARRMISRYEKILEDAEKQITRLTGVSTPVLHKGPHHDFGQAAVDKRNARLIKN